MNTPLPTTITHAQRLTAVFEKSPKATSEVTETILVFAFREGLRCRNTAEKILTILEKSDNLYLATLDAIECLSQSRYFYPTAQISDMINVILAASNRSYEEHCSEEEISLEIPKEPEEDYYESV